MGSRLRPIPDKIFECLVEVTAPVSESEGAKLASFFPENYEDVKMLEDVVTKFCFPFAHDAEMVDAVQHFAFVLTDIDGLFRFGFCRYPPRAKTCLCILSDLPAFEMFYGILNTLAELENKPKKESVTSKQFLDLVLESRVPEPGTKFTVSEPGSGWMRQYNYPDPGKLPSIPENRNLTDYFSAVNPNNMISLFASMMCERRIIVTSKKLSLLTACAYSASLLLYPMHWQHVFIPVIPSSLLDYCSAPMPFLVGVHSSLMKKVRDMPLDDVVILDIDKQEIELHGDTLDDVDYLPQDAVSKLNNALKKTTIAIGEYVARAFLSAVVILIGGYRDALKLSNETIIVFEQDLFINSRPHMKSFLENLLKLQLFERFIHHRLEQLNSGEGIDDVFEEQVGLQTESDSKWVSQYKQWMKNRKRHGTQLLNSLSGKTEKATSKAKKFMFSGVKNVKNHGKNGFREAIKGLKEIIDHKPEKEVVSYDNVSNPVQRSSSLPMRRVNAVKPPPQAAARQSIGSIVHDRVNQPPPSPTRSPRPRRQPPGIPTDVSPQSPPPGTSTENAAPIPPPRIPTDHSPPTLPPRGPKDTSPTTPRRPPPRPPNPKVQRPACPPPYQPPKSGSVEIKMRPSMLRHPGEPDVRDLINFYDSQEDLTCESPANNHKDPFGGFHEFNYLNKQSNPLKMNGLSTSDQSLNESEGLLSQTMCALSDDTRQFLRHSRIMMESENRKKLRNSNPSLDEKAWDSPRFQRKPPVKKSQPAKKTLREIAVEQKLGKGHDPVLTHASSAPSLFDPLAGNMDGKSSSDIDRNCNTTSNGGILQQVGFEGSKTDDSDPFLAISQRHRSQQQGGTTAWVANFK